MEKFLEKKDLITLQIIKLFFKVKESWTVSEIAKEKQLSYKTVQKYMAEIKTLFDEKYGVEAGAFFETDGTSYSLVVSDNFDYKNIRILFLNEATSYLLLRDLLLNKKIIRNKFMEMYYISYPTFLKKNKIVKKILADFSLSLDDKVVFKIVGEEKQVRLFSMYFFMEYYKYCGNYEPLESMFSINSIVEDAQEKIRKKVGYLLSFVEKSKYPMIIAINLLRISKGYFIEDISEFEEYAKSAILYDFIVEEIMEHMKDTTLSKEQIKKEATFFVALLRTQPAFERNTQYNDLNLKVHKNTRPIGLKLTEVFIDEFTEYIDLESRNTNDFLLNNLINIHYQSVQFISDLEGFKAYDEYRTYKEEKIFQMLLEKSERIFENMRAMLTASQLENFNRSTNFLMQKYYKILCGIVQANKFLLPINIKVISTSGEYVEKDIATKIKTNLSDFNIQIIQEDDSVIDVLVTDSLAMNKLTNFPSEIFSYVSPFTSYDYLRLKNKVLSIERDVAQ